MGIYWMMVIQKILKKIYSKVSEVTEDLLSVDDYENTLDLFQYLLAYFLRLYL